MHRLADVIQSAVSIPLLHIADATALAVKASGIDVVALLGTRYTMELDYYVGRLRTMHGLTVIVPTNPIAPQSTESFTTSSFVASSIRGQRVSTQDHRPTYR